MAQITQTITVEVAKPNLFQAIVAKQGDSKSRFLEVTLIDVDGKTIGINPTSSVTINAKRPDGSSKRFKGVANKGDTVTVPLAAWILEQPGIVFCDISVINTADQRVLTSTSFRLNVEEAACGTTDITDDENYDVLVKLIEEVEEITTAKANGEFDGKDGADAFQFLTINDMAEVEEFFEEVDYTPHSIYVLWGGEDGVTYSYVLEYLNPSITLNHGDIWRITQKDHKINGAYLITNIKGPSGKTSYETAKEGGYLGTEEEFAEKLATDYIDWFGTGVSIPENADLDDYKTNGKYYCNSESRAQTLLNRPEKMNTNFCMWVFTRTTSSIKSQLILTLTGKMFLRSSSSSAWRSWTSPASFEEIEDLMATVKEELRVEIMEIINSGGYETVGSVDEMTDTSKSYVLDSTGTVWVYGEAGLQPNFTNRAVTLHEGYRYNSSGILVEKETAVACEEWIPFEEGVVVRVRGLGQLNTENCIGTSDPSKSPCSATFKPVSSTAADNLSYSYDAQTDTATLTSVGNQYSKYIRVVGILSGTINDVIITVNEEITYSSGYAWYDTKMKPSEVGNGAIVDLLVKVNENKANIEHLDERVTAIESGDDSVTIPSFWQSAVDECIAKIKALQVGRNCVTFPFFSDNHTRDEKTQYCGIMIAHIMKECDIPYCFYGGDLITSALASIADADAEFRAQAKAFENAMSYVPEGRFCIALGNHEGYLKQNTNIEGSTGANYDRNQVYDIFMRKEGIFQNKHFGGDGTYYYVDDIASKVRWIVLNSNGIGNSDIDADQLSWLENTALKFNESGWGVVIISHIPITNHYAANITNSANVISKIKSYINGSDTNKADIIGWYSGHIHRDRIFSGVSVNDTDDTEGENMGFKQITITSDHTGIAYPIPSSPTWHAVGNDAKSHAIDFVTINKDTRTVNITRLGIGDDRSYTY